MLTTKIDTLSNLVKVLFFSFTCCAFLLSHSGHAADVAGRIIMARGDVQAINSQGESRQLKRRDSVYSHEVIKTGAKSKVQIRFIDNALLALKANSELNIKAYVYSEVNDNDNQVLMELVTGGFRTLTGKIGKGNKEAYKVDTPVASIGIRGTLYDVQIAFDKILAGVWNGGISLNTQQGSFDLGMDANFDFGEISQDGSFTGLLTPPEAFTPPTPKQKQDSPKNNEGNDEQAGAKGNFKTDNHDQGQQANNQDIGNTGPETSTEGHIPSPFEKDEAPNRELVENSDNFEETDPETEPDPDPQPDPQPDPEPDPDSNTSPDLRLNNAEIAQLNADPKLAILMGSGEQRIAVGLNADGNGEDFFLAALANEDGSPNYEVIRRGQAEEVDFSNTTPWSNLVGWGIWNGSTESPIERYQVYDNNQDYTPLAQDLFYMTISPASQAELNAGLVSGRFETSSSILPAGTTDYIATASNGGLVTDVSAGFNVTTTGGGNFTVSNINLDVEVDGSGIDHTWSLSSANGQVDGSSITVDNLAGNLTDNTLGTNTTASGDLTGLLSAPATNGGSIDTFAGGFNLTTDDGSENVGGVLILQTGQ
jgi:hypothetical protein